jgi:predicted regulator of Ras-like GTPase activity (Roadblock/LC7/MglB family)
MGFSEHLSQIVKSVDGAVAASVMGFDGIAVETEMTSLADGLELTTAWVEYANVLNQLKVAVQGLKTGPMSELAVNSERLLTLVRMVNKDYFLVLGLLPSGNYGKGRYLLRITAPKLALEL